MSFEVVTSPLPPLREPRLMDRAPRPTENPLVFLPPLYNLVAPGLYPDETVYRLERGERIALSVSTRRLPNGAGMEFCGWARVINEDGSTQLDPSREEMELEFIYSCNAGTFARLDEPGAPAQARISREVMLLMLGEPPTMVQVPVDPNAPKIEVATDTADWERNPHKAPPGTWLKPDQNEAPMIPWDEEMKLNASIRYALKLSHAAEPEVDVAALLGTA